MSTAIFTLIAAGWLSTGSLVVHIEDSAVRPVAVRLEGPTTGEWPVPGADFMVTGLAPGEYRLRPVFVGAVTGAPVQARVTRASRAAVHVPTAHLGGLRIEADPGICEPGDGWLLTTAAAESVGATHPAFGQAQHLSDAATCHREIGGLAGGGYFIRVDPRANDLPPYAMAFTVAVGQWWIERVRMPQVIVRGRVMFDGVGVPGVRVLFDPAEPVATRTGTAQPSPVRAVTNDEGEYATFLGTIGAHTPRVGFPGRQMQADQSLQGVVLSPGVNHHDLHVGGGRLQVRFTRRGQEVTAIVFGRIVLQASQGPTIVTMLSDTAPREIPLIPAGRYTVSSHVTLGAPAESPGASLTSRVVSVDVRDGMSTDVVLDLTGRPAMLELVDPAGRPQTGAHTVSMPVHPGLRTDDAGRVSLDAVSTGTLLAFRTRDWGMTCHVVTDDRHQRVTVYDATESIVFVWRQDPAEARYRHPANRSHGPLTGATISGVPGATCPIPFNAFSIGVRTQPGGADFTVQLPPGTYTLTLQDGRTLLVTAPGTVEIR